MGISFLCYKHKHYTTCFTFYMLLDDLKLALHEMKQDSNDKNYKNVAKEAENGLISIIL